MGRAPCCEKANVKKGPWSPEEDATLKNYIHSYGTGGNWTSLPNKIGLKRCGKSCRLRWLNYLRPNIKHGGFTEEEDELICKLYISIGSRWSIIAAQLPGRTDNDIKNYWNTKLKKKLLGKAKQISSSSSSTQGLKDSNPDDEKSTQALSNSALERLQLHMQLQGLQSPLSFYNSPLLWPTLQNSLQDKLLQRCQTTADHQEQKSDNSVYSVQENHSKVVDHGISASSYGYNFAASSTFPTSDSCSDSSSFLENKNLSHTGQEERRAYELDSAQEINESKECSLWWSRSNKRVVSANTWDGSSVLQMKSALQEYNLDQFGYSL